jgi:hypothetical protein
MLLAVDSATESLGRFGDWGNLGCLALVLMLVAWEVLRLRPSREADERAHRERMAEMFRAEISDQRLANRDTTSSLRDEWALQRTETNRQNERNADAICKLAIAIQELRVELAHRSHHAEANS